jgi:multidrug efflux pump subunit AcrB
MSIDKIIFLREDDSMATLTKNTLIKGVLFLLFVGLVAGLGFLFWKYRTASQMLAQLQNPDQAAAAEVEQVVRAVGSLILLPEGVPTVATVTDKTQLAGQPFFAKAEDGDKVLLYPDAQRAYLYRPSTRKLVDVAVLNLENTQGTAPVAPASETAEEPAQPKPVIALYNGTTTAGLTTRFAANKLPEDTYGSITIKQNASRTDYTTSIVVDLTNGQDPRAEQIAKDIGLPIQELPLGEIAPNADVLIILGSDQQ